MQSNEFNYAPLLSPRAVGQVRRRSDSPEGSSGSGRQVGWADPNAPAESAAETREEEFSADLLLPQPPLLPSDAQVELHSIINEKISDVEGRLGTQLLQLQESLVDASESIATLRRML
jgi:hypothetical protein